MAAPWETSSTQATSEAAPWESKAPIKATASKEDQPKTEEAPWKS